MRVFLCALTVFSLFVTPALAKNRLTELVRDQSKSSFERKPEEISAKPIYYRGFIIKPQLETGAQYNSNVFLSDRDVEGDFAVDIRPSVRITKRYRDHAFTAYLDARDRRYADLNQENSTTYNAQFAARLTATKSLKLPFELKFMRDDVTRAAPVQEVRSAITQFDKIYGSGGFDYQFNRLNLKLIGHYDSRSFEDGRTLDSGRSIFFSQKDNTEIGASLVGTYDIAEDHAVYAGIEYARQKFDRFIDPATGQDTSDLRSNNSINMLAGLKTRYKDLLIGDIGIGFINQDFDSDTAESVNNFDISADLDYLVSPKLTLNLQASREVNQDNDVVQGVFKSRYLLGAEYEFAHDWFGRAEGYYESYDFIDSNREEEVLGGGLELRYLHSPRFESQLGLGYAVRESNATDRDYDQLLLRYGLITRF